MADQFLDALRADWKASPAEPGAIAIRHAVHRRSATRRRHAGIAGAIFIASLFVLFGWMAIAGRDALLGVAALAFLAGIGRQRHVGHARLGRRQHPLRRHAAGTSSGIASRHGGRTPSPVGRAWGCGHPDCLPGPCGRIGSLRPRAHRRHPRCCRGVGFDRRCRLVVAEPTRGTFGAGDEADRRFASGYGRRGRGGAGSVTRATSGLHARLIASSADKISGKKAP